MTYKLIKWGALLCEVCLLLMFYSAALLAPVPFGFIRIGCVLFAAAASCALAYFVSSRSKVSADTKRLPFNQLIFKPAFAIWVIAVIITMLQLASGLAMVYLASRK